MGTTMKDLGIDRWSPAERERLPREIWASLQDASPVRPLSMAELAQHDAELDSFCDIDLGWDEVFATSEASA